MSYATTVTYDEGLRKFMINMFNHTALGLALSGIVAFFTYASGLIFTLMTGPMMWITMLAPLGMIFWYASAGQNWTVSKIKNFYQFEPTISFNKNNIIFFDNKGSILQFDNKSKLVWKKNYYSKFEKKLNPILQFANNNKFLIVADNLAKYYMVDLTNGELIWSKNNDAPFNSEIKIYKDKFFVIDFSNILRCFSIKDGSEIWNIKTEQSLIRSQKKLSMVIVDEKIYFNNSIGDISAVDIQRGELLWQLPTQSSLIYESSFSLETSDLITDSQSLFFSNNKNEFFSIDLDTGSFNWKNKVNSNLRPSLINNYLFSNDGGSDFFRFSPSNILELANNGTTHSTGIDGNKFSGLNVIHLSAISDSATNQTLSEVRINGNLLATANMIMVGETHDIGINGLTIAEIILIDKELSSVD